MRRILVGVVALGALATFAATAGANGSPYSPGLTYGWDGVRAPNGDERFVTLADDRRTMVAAIRVNGGRVVRSRSLRGFYGVPLVAYDGSSGGLSGDRRSLVVASYGPRPREQGETRFAVLAARTLRPTKLIVLPGSWSYDAISPDGSLLYLVQHLTMGVNPRYRVRVYDVGAGRLQVNPIVDRTAAEATMRGQPATRVSSADGRWAFTLYARQGQAPFVHALDTARREAICVDLPLRLAQQKQMTLRLTLAGDGRSLSVRHGGAEVASIDVRALASRVR